MKNLLIKIGKKSKRAFASQIHTNKKNKILKDYCLLIKKNKKLILKENQKAFIEKNLTKKNLIYICFNCNGKFNRCFF